ncbi:uncharacterized protein FSUBG_11616 [Fusarium subglutinans]|uniref:Uncharacterized protein n=1 Tax=Gibberella subglutinans TaxID=42677 RepID=A0A8H5LAG3_GIBSU|nr:uncharacterized protein FSUBG_11616 [Fusarium subglutinans]KAF5588028.1 hypothetical protein FSUBG_11616 [Fusarium subglutinans]
MDPTYREKLTYSLSLYLMEAFNGDSHCYHSVKAHVPVDLSLDNKIEEILAVLDPEDFLSQALRYYKHCSLDPKGHQTERRILEIQHRLDDEYGQFLKDNNLLEYTAHDNWLEGALKAPLEGRTRWRRAFYAIDSGIEELTGVPQKPRPKDSELLTICPATIESSFSILKPFDYTERYSLHYISLRKYSNMAHKDADREAQSRLDDYKAEHFERMREESRQLLQWEEREKVRDWKYWTKIKHNPDEDMSEEDESEDEEPEDEESEDKGSEDEGSEDDGSENGETEGDGASSLAGMEIDLPEPTSEDLTTQISVLQISGKKSNGEGGGLTKTAKKRPFDDSDDTDDAAASGYKRVKVEAWRARFDKYGWM